MQKNGENIWQQHKNYWEQYQAKLQKGLLKHLATTQTKWENHHAKKMKKHLVTMQKITEKYLITMQNTDKNIKSI